MPAHVQMKCTDEDCGGSCNACCLAWCSVCGGGEAGLPTDCPGERMAYEREEAVARGKTDYLDAIGWHEPTEAQMRERSPRFA